jgi:hypothetical protein
MLKRIAKTIGLPALALTAALAFAAPQADAAVRFGIGIGGPVYAAPVPVAPYAPYAYGTYGYPSPYAYPSPYYTAPYPYVAPSYVAPYGGFGFGFGSGGHDRYRGFSGSYGHGYGGGFRGGSHGSFRGGRR